MGQGSYLRINLTANLITQWPTSYGTETSIQDRNDVNASVGPFSIIMPDATQVFPGRWVVFNNISVNTFNVMANDGTTLITAVAAGKLIEVYLYDSSTANGLWRTPAYASGTNAIVNLTAESTDNSVIITNGVITPGGGVIDFTLPESLSNFNAVASTGFPAIISTAPLEFAVRNVAGSTNIQITDGNGVANNPTVTLSDEITGLTSVQVGGMSLIGTTISTTLVNTNLILATSGTGDVSINGVLVDTIGNISEVGNLSVNGTFSNSLMPKVFVVFKDTLVGMVNVISIVDRSNSSATVTRTSAGTYAVVFGITLPDDSYGAVVSTGTDGGSTPFRSTGSYVTSTMTTTGMTVQVTDVNGIPVTSMPYGVTVEIKQS